VTALAAAAALPVPGGPAAGQAADLVGVFDDPASDRALGPGTRRLAGLLDPGFLAGAGWDPVRLILEVPAGHRLLGWQQCRVVGCISRGDGPEQVCLGCRLRLAANGLGLDEVDLWCPGRLVRSGFRPILFGRWLVSSPPVPRTGDAQDRADWTAFSGVIQLAGQIGGAALAVLAYRLRAAWAAAACPGAGWRGAGNCEAGAWPG
jgi:hypothetical protein